MQENLDNKVSEPINVVNPLVQVEQQSKQSNFLTILLSVLLFVAVSIAGFFAYQTQVLVKELTLLNSSPSPVSEIVSEPTTQPFSTDSAVIDPTFSWKTYTGKIFTFKYPEEMILKRQDIEDPSNSKNIGDMVQLSDGKYNLQISSNFNGGWGGNPCLTIKDRKIDSLDSQVMYFGKNESGTDSCMAGFSGLVALVGNKTFEHPYPVIIELQPKDANGLVEENFFNQILSNFKISN